MISLKKNGAVNLSKEANGAKLFEIRAKWDINGMTGEGADIDIMAILCDANKKCIKPDDKHVIFYNNLKSACESVVHSGDERTGGKEGWDEVITMDFSKMPANIDTVPVILSIFDESNRLKFGNVTNLEVQVFDVVGNRAVASYVPELENDSDTVMVIGEFVNKPSGAFFKAIGEGSTIGVPRALEAYGVEVQK